LAADANGVVWNEAIGDTFAVVGPSLTSPMIATLPGNPSVLTIDANYIYWYDSAGTSTFYRTTRVPVNQLFTTGQVLAGTVANAPVQLAVDSNYLYWTDSVAGTVSRVSITSVPATASVLANNQSAPTGIAVDDVSVYWINSGNNTVMKLAKPQ
jgi:sugar lactone lactonase YvrE